MLRRLLTCLAVLTGLAAAAPAQAETVRSLVSQVDSQLSDKADCQDDDKICECRARTKDGKRIEDKDCPREKRRTIYIPPVYLGSDLALE